MANLLEYQARTILEESCIPIPPAVLVSKTSDLRKIKSGIWRGGFVVKAQVAAGGRGKAGGVKIVAKAGEAREAAREMLGASLATNQSAGSALKIKQVLVTQKVQIDREFYLAAVLSRKRAQPVLLISSAGGMGVEEIAKTQPQALVEIPIEAEGRVPSYRLRSAAVGPLQIPGPWINSFIAVAQKTAKAYWSRDLVLLEINPLALTPKGFLALDAKANVDENAFFRQPGNEALIKINASELTVAEKKAKALGISYVPVGGNIGCLVNGAGLAMATMDLIASHGQMPANFLDVGGGADVEQVRGAFELLLAGDSLSAIFVNIFGGIMRCDIIAQALVEAGKKRPLKVPLVARLLGTNVQEARNILEKAHLKNVQIFEDLEQAVRMVCQIEGKG
ncbi:MAG: ADP-forming succinate--CoA ligase subunit beta [Elusimicrobiota bacterium]